MRKRLISSLVVMAVIGFVATGAHASLTLIDSGQDMPNVPCSQPAPNECSFVEGITGVSPLTVNSGSFTVTGINSATGTVEWSGLTDPVLFVLVVDGGGNDKFYNLCSVSLDEQFDSDGAQPIACCDGEAKGISHVTFLTGPTTSVPEPSLLLLLGTGLLGTLALGRKRR
jgi:PEP-CTERM motif